MTLAKSLLVRVVIPSLMLACSFIASPIYGFDVRFTSGRSALGIPFELVNNHIYLKVSVSGSEPLTFILDTGASVHLLSLRNAKSFGMNLQPIGKVSGGAGAAPPDVYLATDKVSLSLPGVVLSDQVLVATSFDTSPECSDQASEGGGDRAAPLKVMDGVLGKGFFDSFVVEIDYAARKINLYDPQAYKYKGKGKNISLELDNAMTIVQVRVKAPGSRAVPARLIVDTGAGGSSALTLNKQFAEKHGLLPPTDKLAPSNECGIGGAAEGTSYVGTLKTLRIGRFKLADPETFFRKNQVGEGYDGLLGGPALRNFKVIFDYSRSRMILERTR